MRKNVFVLLLLCNVIGAKAQWTTVDIINFNGLTYETDINTNGTTYWNNATSPTAGPRNGLINGSWEVANTGLAATQSPADAANGRFLMYWSDNSYSGVPAAAAGTIWSKTYTGLTIGKTYRYSFLSGYLLCNSCTPPTNPTLPILSFQLDGTTVQSLPTMTTSWKSASYTFVATATSHTLSIYNSNGNGTGNDFGLDDIKLETFSALPVKLISFTGTTTNSCETQLNWQTASEINSAYFVVEESIDGRQFTGITKVISKNNTTGSTYQFITTPNTDGTHYYRLLMVDKNGLTEYSNIIQLKACDHKTLSIYPNPVTDKVIISGVKSGDLIKILNVTGQIVMSKTAVQKSEVLTTSKLPNGVYYISITAAQSAEKIATKIIKK